MKKILYIILILNFISFNISAQNYTSSIGVSAGYAENGYAIQASYNYHLGRYSYIQGSLFTGFSKQDYELSSETIEIPYSLLSFNLGYFNTVWKNRRENIALLLGGGGIGGYENINYGVKELPNGAIIQTKSKFILGVFLATEIEVSISDSYSLVVRLQQYYHPNSDLGKFVPYFGAGIRYLLF